MSKLLCATVPVVSIYPMLSEFYYESIPILMYFEIDFKCNLKVSNCNSFCNFFLSFCNFPIPVCKSCIGPLITVCTKCVISASGGSIGSPVAEKRTTPLPPVPAEEVESPSKKSIDEMYAKVSPYDQISFGNQILPRCSYNIIRLFVIMCPKG